MKKRMLRFSLFIIIFSILLSIQALAGQWNQNDRGWWYQYDDGGYPVNQWSEIDDYRYYFDANGYMQTGVVEVEGKKYYLSESGYLLGNCTTEEGYKLDYTGEIVNDVSGIVSMFTWSTGMEGDSGTSSFVMLGIYNESNTTYYINNACTITTDGGEKTFYMVDRNTFSFLDRGVIEPYQKCHFVFASPDYLSEMSFNESSTLSFDIYYNGRSYSHWAVVGNGIRFHVE